MVINCLNNTQKAVYLFEWEVQRGGGLTLLPRWTEILRVSLNDVLFLDEY